MKVKNEIQKAKNKSLEILNEKYQKLEIKLLKKQRTKNGKTKKLN